MIRYTLLIWILVQLIILVEEAYSSNGEDYCYEGNCGPSNWRGKCKFGTTQSPINIFPRKTRKSKPNRKLTFSKEYYEPQQFEIRNTGNTVQLSLANVSNGTLSNLRVKGAGWKGEYAFIQMHFHWGSEHLIKGVRYPLELHLVHTQVNRKGGLGVVGIVYGDSNVESKVLEPIIKMLGQVKYPTAAGGKGVIVTQEITLIDLFPKVWDVFRYEGSLTTPPCSEKILWSVFTQRMPVSKSQVQAFKTIQNSKGQTITKNYRPAQPVITKTRRRIYWMPVDKNKMIENAF